MKRELGIARCGLACCLCSENISCKGCKRDGFMELSWCKDAEGCEVRRCSIDKNLNGCYECEPAECRKGLYSEKIKPRAFAEFARRYGVEELLDCLERNEKAGIVYHREGIMGDYDDFDDLEELIDFIKTGEKCGFTYQWRSENVDVPLMHEKRTGHESYDERRLAIRKIDRGIPALFLCDLLCLTVIMIITSFVVHLDASIIGELITVKYLDLGDELGDDVELTYKKNRD